MDDRTDSGLCARLNKASRKLHTISNALVNFKLVALFSDRTVYAKAISQFYFVFVALESALDEALKRGDADIVDFKDILQGSLYRAGPFRKDLEYFLGTDWQASCGAKSTALREYEHHLRLLAETSPRLLLAHCFTQHLGMASGGQMVRLAARKHLGLPEDQGTASFEYPGASASAVKAKFKSQLDKWAAGLSEEHVQQLIHEHLAAFQFNNAIMRAFPIPATATVRGLVRITPRPLLLLLAALLVALLALAVPWVARALRPAAAA